MSQVPPEIMNIMRREMHDSETIISAYDPDARQEATHPEQSLPRKSVPVMRRILERFTMNISKLSGDDREGRGW